MVGCSTEQTTEGASAGNGTASASSTGTLGDGNTLAVPLVSGHEYSPEDRMGGGFDNPASPLSKRVFYFDYDKSDVRAEDRAILVAHAQYLANNKAMSVTVEGHTDERGTREYNLALGEHRAQSVRQLLQISGAAPNQVEVVSYGQERPAAVGHDESAWKLNRRVEIIYRRQ